MRDSRYLIIHKDHPLEIRGANSGAEMATRCLARALVQTGKQVIVAAQLLGVEEEYQGVQYWDLGPDFNVGAILARAHALGPYHLISAGRAQAILESRSDSLCQSRILISHDRSGNDTGIKPEILCRVADKIICVSDAQKQVFLRAGATADKLITLYNGVDLDLFQAGDSSRRNYRRLVFVGALVEDKGIHWLLDSFCELKAKFPDLSLDVYGSADLWGRPKLFDEQAIQRQVPGIKFHGKVSQKEIAEAYQTAGLCVIPSIWFDPFPLTALEAQACGCPVFAFDVGGLKEGILDGETGVVAKEITPQNLTRTLEDLLSNPDQLRRMSEQALQKSRPRFTWDKVAQGVLTICENAKSISTSAFQTNNSPTPTARVKKRLGFLSTWNQECGLATYARFLLKPFPQGSYVVLAEATSDQLLRTDEDFVDRCWRRGNPDFSALLSAIEKHDIGLLHLNCQARFFPQPEFSKFLSTIRARGIKVVAHVHNVFTIDPQNQALFQAADQVIVHSAESSLEAVANGATAEKVKVLPHGVEVRPGITASDRLALRKRLALDTNAQIIVSFGFIQPHKGIEGLIEGIAHLKRRGLLAYGVVAGKPMQEDPQSAAYFTQLQQLAKQLEISERIIFLNRFLNEEEVGHYLQAADVVLMNYHSQHYEASGACSLAVGAGAVVAASLAPPFVSFGAAVWHLTSGYPVPLALEILLTNEQVRSTLKTNCIHYCETFSWEKIRQLLLGFYSELMFEPVVIHKEKAVEQRKGTSIGLRVLMQNRPNIWTHPGGDSVVMEKTIAGLKARGVEVQVDLEGREDPAAYDVVHLFNFALPDLTRQLAQRAVQAGTPYVVTTLSEDVSSFHNQAIAVADSLIQYVKGGQDSQWYARNRVDVRRVPASPGFDNRWTSEHAAALIANGEHECQVLRRDYPNTKRIVDIKLGFEIGASASPDLFINEYKVKDFVLCVGRLESRKNQLMLLKALENSDLTLVFAAGGFSYQPDFEQAVRNFRRRGQTLVLGRLSPQMLASAYAAARIHVLPSWYELPGLVSLEAAYFGRNVVVSPYGTAADYFGDKAFYCEPDNEHSIYNAVLAAYYSPVVSGIQETVRTYRWDSTAEATLKIYEEVTSGRPRKMQTSFQTVTATPSPQAASPAWVSPQPATFQTTTTPQFSFTTSTSITPEVLPSDFQAALDRGERAAKEGLFSEAHEYLGKAEKLNPQSARAIRARGTVFLAEGKQQEARNHFARSLALDPTDAKTVCGQGMCELLENRTTQAYPLFIEALRLDPAQVTAIHQLIRCSYTLNRFDDLERVLRRYVADHPTDREIEFCLAGCLYKTTKLGEAQSILDKILQAEPGNRNALELKAHIAKENPTISTQAAQRPQVTSTPSWTAPTSTPSAAVTPVATMNSATGFDSLDTRLQELEEWKRDKKWTEVGKACEEILSRPQLRSDQRERASLVQAEAMVLNGDIDPASAIFEQILKANPACARALCGKGAIAAYRSSWTDAVRMFEEALRLQPNYDVALAGLGVCAVQNGNKEGAWSYFWKALQANPENMRAIMGIIEAGYPLRRFNEIEQALKVYLEMHPADLEFVYSLAGCLFAQNKIAEARSEVDKIILFKPSDERALELQRMIQERTPQGFAASA